MEKPSALFSPPPSSFFLSLSGKAAAQGSTVCISLSSLLSFLHLESRLLFSVRVESRGQAGLCENGFLPGPPLPNRKLTGELLLTALFGNISERFLCFY